MQDYCLFIPTFMQYLYRIHAKKPREDLSLWLLERTLNARKKPFSIENHYEE